MYQYDVFISYKRGGAKAEWISGIFLQPVASITEDYLSIFIIGDTKK